MIQLRACLVLAYTILVLSLSGCQEKDVAMPTSSSSPSTPTALTESLPAQASSSSPIWRSELYEEDWSPPENVSFADDKLIQDFSYAGYARGERAIPALNKAKVFDVVADFQADPSGKTDSTLAIQEAINAAAANRGGLVYLPEGKYRISPQGGRKYALIIKRSNITLRGAGPEKTFLFNTSTKMRGKSVILVQPSFTSAQWTTEEKPVVVLTQDLMGPSTTLPVESTKGFQVGDTVVLRSDPTEEWIQEHHEAGWIKYANKIGSIRYLRRIKEIDPEASTLTIDAPTRYYLKKRDNARVYPKRGLLENIGLENFSIGNLQHPGRDGWGMLDFVNAKSAYAKRIADGFGLEKDFARQRKSAYDAHFSFLITYRNVVDSWISHVDSYADKVNSLGVHMLSNGIRLTECRNVTIADCTMRRTQYGGGGGNGYMFRLDNSNDCLLQDCVAEFSRHGYSISGMACSGNVFLRCLDKNTASQIGGTGHEETAGRGSDSHMYFSHSNLYDNCLADNSWFEARDRYYKKMSQPKHNLTSAHTVFWNTKGIANSFHPFVVWSQQARYGYVIGTRGPVSGVRTDGNYPDRFRQTAPIDHVEGVGNGDNLTPNSLYQDQLTRRLAKEKK